MSKHTDRLADLEDLRSRYSNLAVDYVSTPSRSPDRIVGPRKQIYELAVEAKALTQQLVVLERRIGQQMDHLQ